MWLSSSVAVLGLFAVSIKVVCSMEMSEMMKNYPTAHSANNRVLGLLLAFNLDHLDPLVLITNEYVSMCESGWNPTMVLFTTVTWSPDLRQYLRNKTFCYRINDYLDLRFANHDKSEGTNLASFHRAYIAREIDNFDVFAYHEDDIILKNSHLSAYLSETKNLYVKSPETLSYSLIGFQRFRRFIRTEQQYGITYSDQDVIESDLLEETPYFQPICVNETRLLRVRGNTHQGMWVLTRGQVTMLEERCHFTSYSSPSREHMSSFSLFSNCAGCCSMDKLLPEYFSSFLIQHYYQQRHVSWTPTFEVEENLRKDKQLPGCWIPLHDAYVAENATQIAFEVLPVPRANSP